MRNLLLLLVLANILYLLWGMFRGDDPAPGVDLVDEAQLGPKIELAEPVEREEPIVLASEDDPIAGVDEAPDSGDAEIGDVEPEAEEPVELTAILGRSCVSIGPFRQRDDADRAQMPFLSEGIRTDIRTTTGEIFIGHWVQIREIASREQANTMLATLKEEGLGEAYLISSEDEGLKISIGLFGEAEGAERVELQVGSLGLPAEIVPRTNEGTLYYVDVALPPGRGAGQIIEQYGEDRVLLREAANCPGSA